ncbi:hypothetical protein DEI86_15365 [Curtobacterium sp. MCBD17_028]|nr:hypothetical protein DEI86_15365 [Curtobacterium sp. MCBD17_028]
MELASPRSAIPLPPTVTGRLITGAIWVPDAVPSEPEVVVPPVVPVSVLPVPVLPVPVVPEVPLPVVPVELASPRSAIPLPPMVTGRLITGAIWVPDAVPSEPEVVVPPVVPVSVLPVPVPVPVLVLVPVPVVPEVPLPVVPVELASPRSAIPLPPMVTGRLITGAIWVPDAVPSEPEVVVPPVVPVSVLPVLVPEVPLPVVPVELASPRSAIPLPPTVTGALTTGATCVPEAVPSEPEVVGPDPDAGVDPAFAAGAEPPELVPVASPRTAMLSPVAAIGAATSGATWVPPRTLSEPEVVAAGAAGAVAPDAEAAAGVGAAAGAGALVASPPTATAVEPRSTGTLTVGTTCVPDAMPPEPEVDAGEDAGAAGADAGEDAGAAGADAAGAVEVLVASPRTLTASPVAETGRPKLPATCVPEAMPSVPVVSAAWAASPPPSERPLTKRVNHSPLETYLFMVVLLM